MLFDASQLPVEENQRQTVEVVAEARRYGAQVEGEIESITGVEDGIGSDTEAAPADPGRLASTSSRRPGSTCSPRRSATRTASTQPTPTLDAQRVTDVLEATGIPCALHGGSGLTDEQFHDLIARGCAKVNISTALKRQFMQSNLAFLRDAEKRDKWDPPSLFKAVQADTVAAGRRVDAHLRQRRQGRVSRVPALIFDCDGVLADTERYGHLPAFNQTFAAFGIPVHWSDAEYAQKVLIGGGKERMASLLTPEFVGGQQPADR